MTSGVWLGFCVGLGLRLLEDVAQGINRGTVCGEDLLVVPVDFVLRHHLNPLWLNWARGRATA